MLAVVIPVGVVILSTGMSEVAEFNYKVGVTGEQNIDRIQEDVTFEHVRFVPSTDQVILSLRNTGSIDTGINKITIVKMDTQDLILSEDNLAPFISLQDFGDVTINANLPLGGNIWNDTAYMNSDYKISVITSRGNFFDTVARPFNT